MDFDYYMQQEISQIEINGDPNLNEVSDFTDLSDNELGHLEPLNHFDFEMPSEDTLTFEDMTTALNNDIVIAGFDVSLPVPVTPHVVTEPTPSTSKDNDSDEDYQQECSSSSDDSSTDDEDYEPEPAPIRRRVTKRPVRFRKDSSSSSGSDSGYEDNKIDTGRRQQNRKAPNIAHWLYNLLDTNDSALGWTGNHREFKILDQKRLATMWGTRKGNPNMTYNNVARTMRFHYKKSKGQELEEVPKKLVYKFSKKFMVSLRASSPVA